MKKSRSRRIRKDFTPYEVYLRRKHIKSMLKSAWEIFGYLLGALSIFVFIFEMYLIMWLLY